MKEKNGFTLIELLAIIIILAIIAVITVPIILNIIDDSKKNMAIDSAYLYRDAINKFYMNKVMNDKNYDIEDGEYDISYFVNEGLDVSGKKPSAGWVLLESSEITDFSFKIGDYAVTYVLSTDTIEAVKDGELALTPTQVKVQTYLTSLKQANSTATDIFNLPVEGVSNGDITDGWVALYDGDVIGYSLQVGDKTVSLLNKNDSIENIITSLASTYISGLTTPNSETIVEAIESGKLKGGFIQYVSENSSIVISDYSLKYEIDGVIKYANYVSNQLVVQDVKKVIIAGTTQTDGAKYLSTAQEVYYNPSTGEICDSSDSVSTTGTTTGCLHWYLYSVKGDYANMILDHNITVAEAATGLWVSSSDYKAGLTAKSGKAYQTGEGEGSKATSAGITYSSSVTSFPAYGDGNNSRGPLTALNTLKLLTTSWITGTPKVPNCTSTNEHIIPSSMNDNKYQIDYTGYHARLITYEEAGYIGCTISGNSCPTSMKKGTNGEDETVYANIYGYWTSSPYAGRSFQAWTVNEGGRLVNNNVDSIYYGIRPVITVLVSEVF